MEVTIAQFIVFLLVLIRVVSMIVTAPLLGHTSVPIQVKVGLGVVISYLLFPLVSKHTPVLDVQLAQIILFALKESLVGILIGFSLGILFAGIRYAGELMSFTMSLTITNVFDPESGQSTPVLGEFMYLMTLLIFLLLNGHHHLLESLYLTFRAIPLGAVTFNQSTLSVLVNLSGLMFVVAVKMAAPVIVAGFLTNIGLSLLARVMPQANIFMLGFPISIGVGLLVLLSSAPFLVLVFKKLLTLFETNMVELVRAM